MKEFKFGNNKIYLTDDNGKEVAVITYFYQEEDVIAVDYTFVDESLRGQGIARELVEEVVSFARKNNLKIVPLCPYVVKVFERGNEYEDVYKKG